MIGEFLSVWDSHRGCINPSKQYFEPLYDNVRSIHLVLYYASTKTKKFWNKME